MARSGLGCRLHVDDVNGVSRDISNDIVDFHFDSYELVFHGVFNTAPDMSHDVLRTVHSNRSPRNVKAMLDDTVVDEGLFVLDDYVIDRRNTGELLFKVIGHRVTGGDLNG